MLAEDAPPEGCVSPEKENWATKLTTGTTQVEDRQIVKSSHQDFWSNVQDAFEPL